MTDLPITFEAGSVIRRNVHFQSSYATSRLLLIVGRVGDVPFAYTRWGQLHSKPTVQCGIDISDRLPEIKALYDQDAMHSVKGVPDYMKLHDLVELDFDEASEVSDRIKATFEAMWVDEFGGSPGLAFSSPGGDLVEPGSDEAPGRGRRF